jgi:hypothetical protein
LDFSFYQRWLHQNNKTLSEADGVMLFLPHAQIHSVSSHHKQYKMTSDPAIPSAEKNCIIKFLVKEK